MTPANVHFKFNWRINMPTNKVRSLSNHQSTQTNQRAVAAKRSAEDPGDLQAVVETIGTAVGDYSRQNPAVVACAVFFLGFYVGWKVKPW
jgi:hypothetical protein